MMDSEDSDIIFSSDHQSTSYWGPGGDRYVFLATGEQTSGSSFIIEAHVPVGGGPPMHIHLREEETFYIVEGSIILMADGKETTLSPGQSAMVPRGTAHTYRNPGDRPAKMVVVFSPAGMEYWFTECLKLVRDRNAPAPLPEPDMIKRMIEAGPRHGVRWVL